MAHVRKLASQNLAQILKVYASDPKKQEEIIKVVNKEFYFAKIYIQRQAYIYMAASVMNSDKEFFEKHMKTNLWNLARDRVCNVRIVLAKVLNEHIKGEGAFYFDLEVNKALFILKQDKDKDVVEHMRGVTLPIQEDVIRKSLSEQPAAKKEEPSIAEEETKEEIEVEQEGTVQHMHPVEAQQPVKQDTQQDKQELEELQHSQQEVKENVQEEPKEEIKEDTKEEAKEEAKEETQVETTEEPKEEARVEAKAEVQENAEEEVKEDATEEVNKPTDADKPLANDTDTANVNEEETTQNTEESKVEVSEKNGEVNDEESKASDDTSNKDKNNAENVATTDALKDANEPQKVASVEDVNVEYKSPNPDEKGNEDAS